MREDRIDNQLVHFVNEGIDTGPIIDNSLSLFPKHCQIPVDFEKYSQEKFLDFYTKFLTRIKNGKNLFKTSNQLFRQV